MFGVPLYGRCLLLGNPLLYATRNGLSGRLKPFKRHQTVLRMASIGVVSLALLHQADENFKHGTAVAVDKVERASGFAHERAFQKVDGGAVFVIDMTVYAAVGFGMVKVVETAAGLCR